MDILGDGEISGDRGEGDLTRQIRRSLGAAIELARAVEAGEADLTGQRGIMPELVRLLIEGGLAKSRTAGSKAVVITMHGESCRIPLRRPG